LTKQLEELQKFKTRHHEEAERDEQSWYEMTTRFMNMTFGSPNEHSQSLYTQEVLENITYGLSTMEALTRRTRLTLRHGLLPMRVRLRMH